MDNNPWSNRVKLWKWPPKHFREIPRYGSAGNLGPGTVLKEGSDGSLTMAPFSFLHCFDGNVFVFLQCVLRGFHGVKLIKNG